MGLKQFQVNKEFGSSNTDSKMCVTGPGSKLCQDRRCSD